jgi:16S rRNA (uracil1498-N3)-methyltransferase
MSLTRLFVDSPLSTGADIRLDQDRARYLGRVLRLRNGDTLSVFNGDDGEFHAALTKITRDSAVVHVVSSIETSTESPLKVHLVQGISRGERMDFVVQKATELGVKRISPVLTEFGMVKLKGDRAAKRRDHWQGVAESACEQSGRIRPPLIDEVVALNSWFGNRPRESGTDLVLRPDAISSLASIPTPTAKLCLLIGPEGGFSDSEYEDAQVAGFQPVSLGPRILRTETAAVAAISIAQSLWGDLGA